MKQKKDNKFSKNTRNILLSFLVFFTIFLFAKPALAFNPINSLINLYKSFISSDDSSSSTTQTPTVTEQKATTPPGTKNITPVVKKNITSPVTIIGTPVSTTVNISDATVLSALERLLSRNDIQSKLRGHVGPQGPAGLNGANGSNGSSAQILNYGGGYAVSSGGNSGSPDSSKQDLLVSGTNIKTINGESVLGSGDMVIVGAGGLSSVVADVPLLGSGTSASHLSIQQANSSQGGYLTSTDWNTFNNKQPAGSYVTGTPWTSAGYLTSLSGAVLTSGSYSNPSWLTGLDYSKLSGTPTIWNQSTTGNAAPQRMLPMPPTRPPPRTSPV